MKVFTGFGIPQLWNANVHACLREELVHQQPPLVELLARGGNVFLQIEGLIRY